MSWYYWKLLLKSGLLAFLNKLARAGFFRQLLALSGVITGKSGNQRHCFRVLEK